MKKILHMTPPDIHNGVYRYIFNHMQYMNLEQYPCAFLTKGAKELRKTLEYKKYGFDIYELKGTQREDEAKFREEIIDILNNRFDILHLHTSTWRGFLIEEIAMEYGVPRVIVHSHSTDIDEENVKERKHRMDTHEYYKERFSMKYATDVWACSKLAGEWLYGDLISKERIQVMPNAIDTEKYSYNINIRKKIRERFDLKDKFVVGNLGRYCYQKNQEFLLRFFSKACKKNETLHLLCLGEGEALPQLRILADTLGISAKVSLMEWQDNVEEFLQAMDVFCLPSRFEGLPISAVEAQAAGLRCLIADTITREIQITELVTFIPLKEKMWEKELLNICRNGDQQREGWDEIVAQAGYDIKFAAKRLEKMYESNGTS